MILEFNYEELRALRSGARGALGASGTVGGSGPAAREDREGLEDFVARLAGDLSLSTLSDLHRVAAAVELVLEHLRIEMEAAVLATHAADEGAVAAYFEFAHVLTVSRRLADMAAEMEALIELVTGEPVSAHAADFRFPD